MKNNMKKIQGVTLILLLCVFLVACADSGEKNSTENISESNSSENAMRFDLSAMDYNPYTDAQSFFTNSRVAKSEHGYYYWDSSHMGFMMYYDIQSGQKVPLCNRPDCRHDDTDCNAWYPGIFGSQKGDVWYDTVYLYFYNDSLYLIGCDKEGYVNLYRVSEDGSSREVSTRLFRADFSSDDGSSMQQWQAPEVCIHRGYIYYIDPREKQPVLRRVKLGGTEPEMLYTVEDGKLPKIYRLKAYGNYLFFQSADSSKESSLASEGLHVYNIKTGEIRLVKDGIIAPYNIADGMLYYYSSDEGIHCCSLATAEDRLVVEKAPDMNFSTDGQNIYFFQEETGVLEVYDVQGKFVSRIEDEYLVDGYCGCDLQYMFVIGSTEEVKHGSASVEVPVGKVKLADLLAKDKGLMAVMDLSELREGKGEWKYLYDFDYLKTGRE